MYHLILSKRKKHSDSINLLKKTPLSGNHVPIKITSLDNLFFATEAKVVEKLKIDGINKKDLTREEFLSHAWDWTDKHGGLILEQLKKYNFQRFLSLLLNGLSSKKTIIFLAFFFRFKINFFFFN